MLKDLWQPIVWVLVLLFVLSTFPLGRITLIILAVLLVLITLFWILEKTLGRVFDWMTYERYLWIYLSIVSLAAVFLFITL